MIQITIVCHKKKNQINSAPASVVNIFFKGTVVLRKKNH